MTPLIWIIDEEWSDYEVETSIIKARYPHAMIKYSGYDYLDDFNTFGKDADLILAQVYTEIPKTVIEGLTKCKGIALLGGGYDRVDIQAAKEKNIPVTNVHGYCAADIADYVLAVIFTTNKPLNQYNDQILNGVWGLQAVKKLSSRLDHQTLLIIGLGIIGTEVAKKALNVGLRVIAADPNVFRDTMEHLGVEKVDLATGLKQADIISVHCNLIPETTHLLDLKEFQTMKKSAILINTSRGRVINEEVLVNAVKNHDIRGAYVDVLSNEPPIYTDPIYKVAGINVTPHISYISTESIHELKKRATNNLLDMYAGELPMDVVNI